MRREDGGLDQGSSSGDDKESSNLEYILEINQPGFTDGLVVGCMSRCAHTNVDRMEPREVSELQ